MKKKGFVLLLSLLLFAAVTAGVFLAGAGLPHIGGAALVAPVVTVHPRNIPPVNGRKAEEIRLSVPKGVQLVDVRALADGCLLALAAANGTEHPAAAALRFDQQGRLLWVRDYPELQGPPANLTALPDGRFAFSGGQGDCVALCSADGILLWTQALGRDIRVERLMAAEDGALIAVGSSSGKSGAKTTVLRKLSRDGALLKEARGQPGAPRDALWAPGMGLVLYGDGLGEDFLVCYDGNLNLKWQTACPAQTYLELPGCCVSAEGLLLCGTARGGPALYRLAADRPELQQVFAAGDGTVTASAAMGGGQLAVATAAGNDGGAALALYGPDGAVQRRTDLPVAASCLAATEDGGLLAVCTQQLRALPQPAALSAIWYDTQAVVTRYDGNLNILWRKTYDKHRNSREGELAVPLANGMVVVEN